jgi:pyruvate dehydrogenase E1 component alpha subunit
MRQVLAPSGELVADAPVDLSAVRRLYRSMVTARLFDRKCVALQTQGRLSTYAPYEGQEACQVGSVAAIRADDWLVATYRDAAAMWMHGFGWESLLLWRTGDERGAGAPPGVPVLPASITVGGHMVHAVGLAWGERLQGRDRIALTLFGDGATSEGDFHEAMNLAAVYESGTVFLCQNNGYAISMPRDRQTKSETIAAKAEAYGMPGLVVDGNDVLAMYEVIREAADSARRGGGPTLIEAITYRLGPHTTNDDPSRYREDLEAEEWRRREPIERVRRYLESHDAWDPAWQTEFESEESAAIEEAVVAAEATSPQTAADMFGAMFAAPTPQLEAQRVELEAEGEVDL